MQRSGRVNEEYIHLAAAECTLQANAQPKLQIQPARQDLRALHQHIDVATSLAVINPRAKEQHTCLVTDQFMGCLADHVLMLRRKTHGEQSIGRHPGGENALT